MQQQQIDKRDTIEVRGRSGHLYGKLDPITMVLEVKRKGGQVEVIDLKQLLEQAKK